jgi:hypothetical protein
MKLQTNCSLTVYLTEKVKEQIIADILYTIKNERPTHLKNFF